jgi:hypothetical protein
LVPRHTRDEVGSNSIEREVECNDSKVNGSCVACLDGIFDIHETVMNVIIITTVTDKIKGTIRVLQN